ncbi:MAG: hypothetical protein EBR15_09265, partial [Gammaproteobacteria bacterium]|nr:hypothetical protein [Gammaproteobacteria bacterium]
MVSLLTLAAFCIAACSSRNASASREAGSTVETMSVLLSKLASMGDTRANAITMMVCVLEPRPGDTEAASL